jgi:hypothetical protein
VCDEEPYVGIAWGRVLQIYQFKKDYADYIYELNINEETNGEFIIPIRHLVFDFCITYF